MISLRCGSIWRPAKKVIEEKIKPYLEDKSKLDELRIEMLSRTNETDKEKILNFLYLEADKFVEQAAKPVIDKIEFMRSGFKDNGVYEMEMEELDICIEVISWSLANKLAESYKAEQSIYRKIIKDGDSWACSIQ